MTLVELTNAQRTRQRQTVRRSAHLRSRRNDIDVTDILQGFLKFDQPIGVDTVVVCYQDPRHTFPVSVLTNTDFRKLGLKRLVRLAAGEVLSRAVCASGPFSCFVCAPGPTSVSPSDRVE